MKKRIIYYICCSSLLYLVQSDAPTIYHKEQLAVSSMSVELTSFIVYISNKVASFTRFPWEYFKYS